MIVITVARKPVEGTVASNALKYGTGGLNIDGCRISSDITEMENRSGKANDSNRIYGVGIHNPTEDVWQPAQQGRWPANLILQHLPQCQQTGTRQVKGSPTSKTFHGSYEGESTTGLLRGVSHPGNQHSDPDTGLETVAAWECALGCPVAHLDEQTGDRRSAYPHNPDAAAAYAGSPTATNLILGKRVGEAGMSYTDEGGASRFFKQTRQDRIPD